ncbi:MAG TPA: ABC transporter permease [Vicinamibacterales bacterium]|nr:ABC transporter permease [Vicinamibacterales bacterium]
MRALRYFVSEAAASLWRGRGAAALAVLTIATGLFVLGFFLLVNTNLQQLIDRWSASAELSVYLNDGVTGEQLKDLDTLAERSGLVAERTYVSKAEALERFRSDFPDLAGAAGTLDSNPFPASFEWRVKPDLREASGAIEGLVAAVRHMPGVADVRYDRDWLARLNVVIRGARTAGVVVVVLLALAAGLTVANVVRLAAAARRDEIEIMQLVGAPFAYVRGPFVAEGVLQGGIAAVVALAGLAAAFFAFKARYGAAAAQALGADALVFLPPPLIALIVAGGMALGCVGGYAVARRVR